MEDGFRLIKSDHIVLSEDNFFITVKMCVEAHAQFVLSIILSVTKWNDVTSPHLRSSSSFIFCVLKK